MEEEQTAEEVILASIQLAAVGIHCHGKAMQKLSDEVMPKLLKSLETLEELQKKMAEEM